MQLRQKQITTHKYRNFVDNHQGNVLCYGLISLWLTMSGTKARSNNNHRDVLPFGGNIVEPIYIMREYTWLTKLALTNVGVLACYKVMLNNLAMVKYICFMNVLLVVYIYTVQIIAFMFFDSKNAGLPSACLFNECHSLSWKSIVLIKIVFPSFG
jgi:hypothetical protein